MGNPRQSDPFMPLSVLNPQVSINTRYKALQNAVTETIAESTDLDQAIVRIIQCVCLYSDWDFGEAWNIDAPANVLVHRAQWSLSSLSYPKFEEISRQLTFTPGLGLPGRVWQTTSGVWIPDVVEDPGFLRASFAAREGLHGGVGLVLRSRDKIVGVLSFFSRTIRPHDNDLLALFETIGFHVGLYVDRQLTQQSDQERILQEAIFQERLRLAQQLQRVTMRSLFSAAVSAETLLYLWESNHSKLWYGLGEVRQSIQQALSENQNLLQLYAERGSARDIRQVLEPLIENFKQKMRGEVSFSVRDTEQLPVGAQIALYCIVQEALDNIVQHAYATRVNIGLTIDQGGNELTMTDDGKGFNPNRVLPDRLGLRIMRGCAETIGGKLDVVTAANQGTKIALTWRTLT